MVAIVLGAICCKDLSMTAYLLSSLPSAARTLPLPGADIWNLLYFTTPASRKSALVMEKKHVKSVLLSPVTGLITMQSVSVPSTPLYVSSGFEVPTLLNILNTSALEEFISSILLVAPTKLEVITILEPSIDTVASVNTSFNLVLNVSIVLLAGTVIVCD